MSDTFKKFLADSNKITESVADTLYQKLIRYKNSLEVSDEQRCEISADEEKSIKQDIEGK